MRNSNMNRQSIVRTRTGEHNEGITLSTLQSKLRNALVLKNVDQSKLEEFQAISNLDQLIEKFLQLILGPSLSHIPATSSTMHKQLLFYQERISSLQKRVKDTKAENLLLLRSVSNKQGEICEKQQEIFELKTAMEEKQKAIIRLMNALREKGKVSQVAQRKEGQEIKIVVNSPPVTSPQVQQQPKPEASKPSSSLSTSDWPAQKQRLLRVLKEKDMKIYQLILQLQSKQ